MTSKKLGEVKGPFIMWLSVISYFATLITFGGASKVTLSQDITTSVILGLLIAVVTGWGPVLLFLIIFVAFWEGRRSPVEIFSSVGLRRKGSTKSVLWNVALLPLFFAIIGLVTMILIYFLGTISFARASVSGGGEVPPWYPYYMIIYSFFPVAVVEEAIGRGYMLDRLMPQHPSSLAKALPAILLSSLLCTLYHLPSYLKMYSLSAAWIVALLGGNVFPWSVALSIAYVRAGTRNILGSVLVHFLADSMPYILMLA